MNSSKQIKIGAILSYISIFLNIGAGLLYTPWMIEKIGQGQYGLYTLAHSLISLFIVDFGLSSATSRYLAKYNAEGNREGAERFLGAVYKLYLVVSGIILVAFTVFFFFLDSVYTGLSPSELEQFKVVYVISALFSIVNFPFVTFNGILTAYEKFVPLKVIEIIYRLLTIGITVVALFLGGGLYALISVHVVVGLFVIVLKFLVIKMRIPLRANFRRQDKAIYREIFTFSAWVTVSLLAQRLIFNIAPSVIGIVATSASIAVFGVITTIEGYTYTLTAAINGLFLPRISRLSAEGNSRGQLSKLMVSVGKFQYIINGLIIAGFAVVGELFIRLWLNDSYQDAYGGVLLVLIPGLFFNTLHIGTTTLVVEKKVGLQAGIDVATGLLNILLVFPLTKLYGVLGASFSIFIACMFRAIATQVVCHKMLRLDVLSLIKKCYIRMTLPLLVTIAGGMLIRNAFSEESWIVFIIEGSIVVVLYALTQVLIGLEKTERAKVLFFLKNGVRFKKK